MLFKKNEALFCHNSLKSFRIIFKILQTTVRTLSRPKDNLVLYRGILTIVSISTIKTKP